MNSKDYIMGFAVGLLSVLIIYIIIVKVKGAAKMKGVYDERQELIRGRGYKYAFFTILGMLAAYLLAEAWVGRLPVPGSVIAFAILITGVIVYAIYCMRNGAFFGIGYNYTFYRIIIIANVLINTLSVYLHIKAGEMVVNGELAIGPAMQVVTVVGFAIIWIAMEIQMRSDRSAAEIEDWEEATDEES